MSVFGRTMNGTLTRLHRPTTIHFLTLSICLRRPFSGSRAAIAAANARRGKTVRIASQIETGVAGFRANPRCAFRYIHVARIATAKKVGSSVGVDLLRYESAEGMSMRGAIDWMRPYYLGTKNGNCARSGMGALMKVS
jgi:hypothetical protein